jgi:hypothetical protein
MAPLFTPQPWTAWRTGRYIEVAAGDDRMCPVIKWMGFAQSGRSLDEQAANATLISAAPDYHAAAASILADGANDANVAALKTAHNKASGVLA